MHSEPSVIQSPVSSLCLILHTELVPQCVLPLTTRCFVKLVLWRSLGGFKLIPLPRSPKPGAPLPYWDFSHLLSSSQAEQRAMFGMSLVRWTIGYCLCWLNDWNESVCFGDSCAIHIVPILQNQLVFFFLFLGRSRRQRHARQGGKYHPAAPLVSLLVGSEGWPHGWQPAIEGPSLT